MNGRELRAKERSTWKCNVGRGLKKLLCSLLVVCLLAGSMELPDVRAGQDGEDMVLQSDREKTWQTERCQISFLMSDCWNGGYNATITVRNTSDTAIDNWHVSASIAQPIRNVWNARMSESTQSETVFKNLGWNQDIAPGESISFGFTAEENFDGFPEFCELAVVRRAVDKNRYEITCEASNVWDGGYTGNLRIHNQSDGVIEDWQLSFDCDCEIVDLWNGEIISREAGRYFVKNQAYNQNIAPGAVVTVGFTVQKGSAEKLPENFVLEEFTLGSGSSGNGSNGNGDGEEPEGSHDGTIEPVYPGKEEESAVLKIDTDAFDLNEAWGMYLTNERVEHLSGTLENAGQADRLVYEIRDVNDLLVSSGETAAQEVWKFDGIGLVLGINSITVNALGSQDGEDRLSDPAKPEVVARTAVTLMNFNQENMETAEIDLSDMDGDGLNNYFESIYGTDPLLADTDGDGLTDWEELTQTGTDPLLSDTDDDGIGDGEEDPDGDGLSNREELAAGTGVLYPDSDGDGLSDGKEVQVYHTDPLVADTDGDGLRDGEDIKLGFDPLNPDTDENGILDGDEIIRQTCTQELDPDRKAGITQVSVSMDCAGSIDDQVLIQNLYNLDMRSTDVVGLFGAPVEIETEAEFETADITFTYDEQALGETDAENLRIMWYDEEEDRYVILDDETVLDKERHTLTCQTTHFSKWMVVDRNVWWTAMRADLGYGEFTESGEYYFDYAYAYNWGRCIDDFKPYLPDNEQLYDTEYASYSSLYGIDTIRNVWKPQEYLHGFKQMSALEVIHLCMDRLDNNKSLAKNKQLYFYNLKDVEYDPQTVQRAIDSGIVINCIAAIHNPDMMRMVSETGGKYLEVKSWKRIDVTTVIYNEINAIKDEYIFSNADSDGDGLYDVYEKKGFRLSNGKIIYTNPLKYDTDDDGINDFLYVGGLPRAEKYVVDGEEFTSMVNRGGAYPQLSEDFIYVDGRANANDMVNDEKMEYVSYSNQFYYDKYEKLRTVGLFKENRDASGVAGVHGLFEDKITSSNEHLLKSRYAYINNTTIFAISLLSLDANAIHCFYTYMKGTGGSKEGCNENGTREYISANNMLFGIDLLDINSASSCFEKNLQEAMSVAESVLNEYNTDIYISLSPEKQWAGCAYVNYSEFSAEDPLQVLIYPAAFGIFNSADASITLHCTYDSATKKYSMEYIYYIVDYYDFLFYELLCEEDALGLAKTYELFGKCPGTCTWEKGKRALVVRKGW